MNEIDLHQVAQTYNFIADIWDKNDKWHWVTHEMIQSFIQHSLQVISYHPLAKILNAGSADNSYGIDGKNMVHIDIAQNKIKQMSNAVLANIEDLPLKNSVFDLIICVGSVINYCDPLRVFQEFDRLLVRKGYIILEFESSCTFELLGKRTFNRNLVLTDTFYNGGKERLWYYSERFIKSIVGNFNLRIRSEDKCHLISPLIYRFIKNDRFASRFACFDNLCMGLPIINRLASNVIYLIERKN